MNDQGDGVYDAELMAPPTPQMSEGRKLEIAMKLLKHILRERGIHFSKNFRRELGSAAKQMDISPDDLVEFCRPIIYELIDEALPVKK